MVTIHSKSETDFTCDVCGCRYRSLEEAKECEDMPRRKVGNRIYDPKDKIVRNEWDIGSLVKVTFIDNCDDDYVFTHYGVVVDTEVIKHLIYPIVYIPEYGELVKHGTIHRGSRVSIDDPIRGDFDIDTLKYKHPTLEEAMANKIKSFNYEKDKYLGYINDLDVKIRRYEDVLNGNMPELKRD